MLPNPKSASLRLFMNGERLGTLARTNGRRISFTYAPGWIAAHPDLPISLRFPVQEEPYRNAEVEAYLKNLLPDSQAVLNRIAALHRIATPDPFDLLAVIGRDCVGAIQFLPEDEEGASVAKGMEKERIGEAEIAATIRRLKSNPLGQRDDDDDYFRISIAGAQEKTALLRWNGRWYRPVGVTPTTHILKPSVEIPFDGVPIPVTVENEWLSLKICEHFGLTTTKATIETFEDVRVLSVERFDRIAVKGGGIRRVMQEDFCQATGTPPHLKYESKGGPGIARILEILGQSVDPARDRAHFFKTQIVFWLMAAIDGHAKNFSIQWKDEGFSLTPIYDVISADPIVALKKLAERKIGLAMAVEGKSRHYRIHEIVRRHWEETAKRNRISATEVETILHEVVAATKDLRRAVAAILPKGFPADIVEPILDGIEVRARRLA